jgi:hypothetical protein
MFFRIENRPGSVASKTIAPKTARNTVFSWRIRVSRRIGPGNPDRIDGLEVERIA